MFNFHKPRVYRSADGCCICRAKSSSSRFTASRKYEKESMQCFNLHEPRNGEICNACVLLVKRYKRLPAGSKRHWGHVVDARAGPGTKSLAKQKKRDNAEAAAAAAAEAKGVSNGSNSSFLPEKFAKIFKKNRKGKITTSAATTTAAAPHTSAIIRPSSTSPTSEHNPSDSNESYDDDIQVTRGGGGTTNVVGSAAIYQTRKRTAAAALAVGCGNSVEVVKRPKLTGSKRRRQLPPKKGRRAVDNVPFFEESDLVRLEVCCGVVFQSLSLGSCCYIIDPELYKPCEKHQRLRQQQHQLQVQHQQEMQQQQKEKLVETAANPTIPPGTTTTQVQSQAAKMGPLKKHHLFFKRQSESFPQGDVVHRISPIPLSKTEANSSHHPLSPTGGASTQKPQHSNLSLILKPTSAAVAQQSSLPPAAASSSTSSVSGVVSVGAASPSFSSSSSNCSTSSSVATKFNDNSSDSGFDEHVLERKSVSPPTQDEWKLRGAATGGMQLILASGLPISGQSQNLVLAGNEFTARIVQQRQQQAPPSAEAAAAVATTGAAPPIKINVVPGGGSQGNSNKLRAIFNSASSIQHENGVTTILPASSLAASNQTAAMNAIAPSTVTITPSSVVGKKVTAAGLAVANPKFILLKPAKFVGQTVPPPPPEAKIV